MIFYALGVIMVALALLPHVWTRLFGYEVSSVIVDFVCAGAWLISFAVALWIKRRNWRHCIPLLITGPFACGPAIIASFVFLVWHRNGFAP